MPSAMPHALCCARGCDTLPPLRTPSLTVKEARRRLRKRCARSDGTTYADVQAEIMTAAELCGNNQALVPRSTL